MLFRDIGFFLYSTGGIFKKIKTTISVSVFMILIFCSNTFAAYYSIQIKASSDGSLISEMVESYSKEGFPVYSTTADVKGKTFHRLRIGPFQTSESAVEFAEYYGFEEFWVVESSKDEGSFKKIVDWVLYDTFQAGMISPSIYLGERNPFVIVYEEKVGFEGSAYPSDLSIYLKGENSAISFREVTGFIEMEGSIQFGGSVMVYSDPEGEPIEKFTPQIEEISDQTGIPPEIIKDELAFWNDGYDGRITVLKEFDLNDREVFSYPELGFDYVDSDGSLKRWQGYLGSMQDRPYLGNWLLRSVDYGESDQIQRVQGENLLLFFKLIDFEEAELCIIFLREE